MRDPKAARGFFKGVATLFVEHPAAMVIAARQSPCRKRCRRGASHASDRKDSTLDTARDCCAAGFRSSQCLFWVIHDRCGRSHASMYVRFCPKADKWADGLGCPLSAKTGLMQGSKTGRASTRASSRPCASARVLLWLACGAWRAKWAGAVASAPPSAGVRVPASLRPACAP